MFSLKRTLVCALLSTVGLPGTPLTDAVKAGDRRALAQLLARRANANEPEPDGSTALMWAARNGDAETVALLLRSGAQVNAANRLGVGPLMLAASNGSEKVAVELIKAGADVNARRPSGDNVLMAAVRGGSAALVEVLLAKGANIEAAGNEFGETALMVAAIENHPDIVKTLLRHGAAVNGKSKEFTYAKDRFGLEGVVTILPRGGWTALLYGARHGATEAVRTLAEHGARLDAADPEGSTPLLLAITNGHFDTAAALLELGAAVNLADSTGMTPLYAAVDMNTLGEVFGRPSRPSTGTLSGLDLISLLLKRGANPNAALKSPTLQRAHTPGEPSLGEGATAMMRAAKSGDAAAIELLIQHGANASAAQKNGATALMFAMGLGRGVSAFAKDTGTEADLLAAAKVLVSHGADVNAKSAAGLTPIHYAAQAADANFAQPSDALLDYLLEHGARVNATDNQGRTPVDMAMGKGLRGRAGGPVKPREATARRLADLLAKAQ
jgi:uncharacterized protein